MIEELQPSQLAAERTTLHHTLNRWLNRLRGDRRFMSKLEPVSGIWRATQLARFGSFALVSGTAYWVYLGRTVVTTVPEWCFGHVLVAGAGAQAAEVGFFSTPSAPNRAGQTMTKLVASGDVGDLTALGAKGNTAALATAVREGTHLWAGVRVAMGVTQPEMAGIVGDMGLGLILSQAGAPVFTGDGPWEGSLIAASGAAVAPDLVGVAA